MIRACLVLALLACSSRKSKPHDSPVARDAPVLVGMYDPDVDARQRSPDARQDAAPPEAPVDPRCRRVCAREAGCPAGEARFDEGDCRAACTALVNDPTTATSVDRHLACVDAAATCTAVTACD